MIRAILNKELTELRRDGRVVGIAWLITLLIAVSLVTGWSTRTEQARQASRAQRDDQATFLKQGTKAPHAAAHFGRMAYKVLPALAVFDPGATPFLGQVIWLEAHRQDPAMFRSAEDWPELRRLADLSTAGILTLLVPLLIVLMGHGAFAAERERGTLRQVLGTGPSLRKLFAGKLLALAAIGVTIGSAVICASIVVARASDNVEPLIDTLVRGSGLLVGYGLYGLTFASLALLISARARTAASALFILLGLWSVSVIVLPRVAASVAESMHPSPDPNAFWTEAAVAIRSPGPRRDSDEFRALELEVVRRALGREVTVQEMASLPLNRQAMSLELAENRGAETYALMYRMLFDTYAYQQRIRRWFALLSPTIALQHVSSALAGTDVAAHQHFAEAAERQRRIVVRRMNEDMMLRGAGKGFDYLATSALWASIPDFAYEPRSAASAIQTAAWDLAILTAWSVMAFWLGSLAAIRQRVA